MAGNRLAKLKIAFLLLMCSYGCLGLVVRGIALPTVVIVWARALISSVSLLLFLLLSGKADWKGCRQFFLPMAASGVFLAVDWIGLFASYRYTTLATATLCYYIVPVLVMLGAAVLLGERLTVRQIVCITVAFIGMVFVSGAAENGLPQFSEIKGVLLALLGAVGYAGVILINKKFPEGDAVMRTFLQLCTSAVIMSAYIFRTMDLSSCSLGVKDIVLLLLLGVVMTAAAYIAYFFLIIRIPSGSVAFFSYADPVVAVLISLIFLAEPYTVFTLLGGVMIIGAAVVSELSQKQRNPGKNADE